MRKVLKTFANFLPIFLVLAGILCCIQGAAQNITTDTIKPVSNYKKWHQNLLPTPDTGIKNKLLMPMAVGYYDFDDNIISVYKSKHKSVIDIIHTIIHEWCHYKQSTKKYYEYDKIFNYHDNPYEIQANELADSMKWKCKKDLFR